jgi:hypothetical protein
MSPIELYFQNKESNVSFSSEELKLINKCENFEDLLNKTTNTLIQRIIKFFK